MTRAVILDVDTGIDDAMALMFAVRHPGLDVRAITCVSGNVSVDQVVANTLAVLDVVGAPDLPVARGAVRPLIEPARDASMVHGGNGLAGIVLPPSSRRPSSSHAVELMYATLVAAEEPLTIIALAPLTNLALLFHLHPDAVDRIERVVFMGGSAAIGNASAVAEFNVWHDPEAAHVVLNSGVRLTMYGLDVFNEVVAPADVIAGLRAGSSRVSRFLGDLLGFETSDPANGELFSYPVIGDAGAVCAVVAPELFEFGTHPLQVELAPGLSRGQTLVDRRLNPGEDAVHAPHRRPWPTASVALEVPDPSAVLDLFLRTLV